MTAAAPAADGLLTRERLGAFMRKYLIVFIFLGMCVLLAVFSPNNSFLKPQNLINVVRQISVIGLLALGVMVCIIALGIDLSLGSVLGLSAVVTASLVQQIGWKEALYPGFNTPAVVALLAGLGVGIAAGAVNGSLIAVFRIPPFIATLGMLTIARGLAYIYSNGRPVSTLTPEFLFIGGGALLGIPFPIIVFGVVILLTHLMLNNTRFGRQVYAIGGNETAARVSGVNIGRTKILIYTFSGLMAGLGGVVLTARVQSGDARAGHRLRARRDRRRRHRRHQLRRRHRHGVGHRRRRADHRRDEQRPRPAQRLAVLPAGRQGRDHHRRDHHRRAQEPLMAR